MLCHLDLGEVSRAEVGLEPVEAHPTTKSLVALNLRKKSQYYCSTHVHKGGGLEVEISYKLRTINKI